MNYIINTNINLNEKKKSNENIVNYGNNNYSQIILEESNRIRTNINKKYENNQIKKHRILSEQINKFVNSFKGNRLNCPSDFFLFIIWN